MKKSILIHEKHYETAISDVAKKITNYIFKQFDSHFNKIVNNFGNINVGNRKILEDELKSEILTKNLNHYLYLLLAKTNCCCSSAQSKYCYSVYCQSNKLTPITNSNNYNASALNHKKRGDKSNKIIFDDKSISIFKNEGELCYTKKNKPLKKVFFEDISSAKFKGEVQKFLDRNKKENIYKRVINEILLFDQSIIKNIFEIIKCDNFKHEENIKLNQLIKESIFDKILLETKMKALHNLFEIGLSIFPPDANKFKNLAKKTNDYIDTTYGAGLYYLANVKPSGYISVAKVKESFITLLKKELKIPKSTIKFTNDHIYRRKLAATYLKNEHKRDFSEFKNLYKERFSYVSFITSKENNSIKSWDKNTSSMEIPFTEFRKIYVREVKKLNVDLIKTEILSETQMKTFIEFLFITKVKEIKNIDENKIKQISEVDIKKWFNYYQNLINLFEI